MHHCLLLTVKTFNDLNASRNAKGIHIHVNTLRVAPAHGLDWNQEENFLFDEKLGQSELLLAYSFDSILSKLLKRTNQSYRWMFLLLLRFGICIFFQNVICFVKILWLNPNDLAIIQIFYRKRREGVSNLRDRKRVKSNDVRHLKNIC